MTRERFDVLVVGLGAMGSAAVYRLARRGVRVLGLDRFAPPHTHGSSHGESRIIREAYFEDPRYVPLVQRALALWAELEREMGRPLLRRTGALMLGPPGGRLVGGALASAREHHLPHESLDAEQVRRHFPAFRPDPEWVGVWEPGAGVLAPEACVQAHLDGARAHGAEIRLHEPVMSWEAGDGGVSVTTERGRYAAASLVLAAGPWLPALVPGLPLEVERQVMLWFRPRTQQAAPRHCPVSLWDTPEGLFYTIGERNGDLKAARHHDGEIGSPDALDPQVRDQDVAPVRSFLRRHLPAAAGELRRGAVCRYTNTPTGHFVVDRHPDHPEVLLVSPCSGHGFKFAAALGEAVAELVTGAAPTHDLSLFGLAGLQEEDA